jgi:phosphoesterase RecJ-like protein
VRAPARNNSQRELHSIQDLILTSRGALLVTHIAPDGDAIGSLLGLGWLLRGLGKDVTMACEDPGLRGQRTV